MNQTVDTFKPGDRVKRHYVENAKVDTDRQGTVVKSVPRRSGRTTVTYRTYVNVLWDGKKCEAWINACRLEKVNKLNEEES